MHYLDLPSECWHFVLKTVCILNAVLCVSNYGLSVFSACLVNDKDIRMMMLITTKITFSLAYVGLSVSHLHTFLLTTPKPCKASINMPILQSNNLIAEVE